MHLSPPVATEQQPRYEVPHKYVYVLVRTDLRLRDQIVQACHASLEGGAIFAHKRKPTDEHWMVMCALDSRDDLSACARHLNANGVNHTIFFEPDIEEGEFTAICTEPLEKAQRKVMKRFKLWSEPHVLT